MTSCDDVQQALCAGDGSAALLAHLEGCEGCRTFAAADRAAQRSRHLEPRLPTRVRRQAVVLRGAALFVVLVGGLVAVSFTRTPATSPVAVVEPAPRPETGASVGPGARDEAREWQAFIAFTRDLDARLHRDLATNDPALAPFGAVASWVSPQSTLTTLEN